jgi:hypothetical protein
MAYAYRRHIRAVAWGERAVPVESRSTGQRYNVFDDLG